MDPEVSLRKRFSYIEPPLFLGVFCLFIAGNVFTDLIIFQSCRTLLGYDNENCTLLHTNSSSSTAMELIHEIQSHISGIMIFRSVISNLISAFTALFLGTWSDKYGRKPLLIMNYFGLVMTSLLLTVICNYNISPMLLSLAYIPFALVGGWSTMILSNLCYITDTSTIDKRAIRLVIMEVSMGLGGFIGTFTGPAVLTSYGYTAVFGTSAVCSVIAGLYIWMFVNETIVVHEKPRYSEIFNICVIKDLLITSFRKRVGFNRTLVWACTFCLLVRTMYFEGEVSIDYLFASAKLGWNVSDFANFTAITVVFGALGGIIGTKMLKEYLGLSEVIVTTIANIFDFSKQLVKAFTWKTWNLYLAGLLGMLSGVYSPMMRSILSKAIPSHEVGKVFSVTVFVEMIAAFVASPLYNLIYSSYLPPIYPCPVWLLSASFIVLITIIGYFIRLCEQSYHDTEYNVQTDAQSSTNE